MRLVPVTCSLMLLVALVACAAERKDRRPEFGFERTEGGREATARDQLPGSSDGTLIRDSVVVHSGRFSCRIDRTKPGTYDFSTVTFAQDVDFTGKTIELRGWLRRDSVVQWTGLWLREDASGGPVQFDNMQDRGLNGTADWTEFRITLPLDARARSIYFGALLAGPGRVWVDELELLVDGKPLIEAPQKTRALSVLDRDTSFVSSSRIELAQANRAQLDNLVLLGKVWGFLKYHHPTVVRGNRHWDFDLFRVAPRVITAKDAAAAQRALSAWVDSLGAVPPCSTCVSLPSGRALAPRLGWLADKKRLGGRLSAQLVQIHKNRPDVSEQFFVSFFPGVGNPDLGNELGYKSQIQPDAGYRLLALFRLWNIIEYWSPYRDLADPDWDGVLREFIPRFLAASTTPDYKRELIALIARVRDTHANLWSGLDAQPPVGKANLPVSVRFIEGKAVVTAYPNSRLGPASGLRVGDVITHLDGVAVDSLVASLRPLYPASNEAARLRDIARSLTRGEAGTAEVSILRDGQPLSLRPERVRSDSLDRGRDWKHDQEGPTFRRLSDDVAYLKLSSVRPSEVDDYVKGTKGARCLIIDLRNYPSDFMVFALGQHLVKDTTAFVKFTVGDAKNPGSFGFGEPLVLVPVAPVIECPVAILIDEVTQSSAEYTTMAFRSRPGTVVVGSQTAGADGNVSRFDLPGAQRTMISGIGVFYPDGRPTQGIGIVPDLEVRPTIAGIRAGRDEVLEAAVRRVLGRDITPAELASLAGPGAKPSP
jgi:C-terminal processing protease CtpA/Prc